MLSGLKKLGQTASNSTRRLTNKARGITPEQRNQMRLQKAAENKMLASSLATSAPIIAAAKAEEAAAAAKVAENKAKVKKNEFNRLSSNINKSKAAAAKKALENAEKAAKKALENAEKAAKKEKEKAEKAGAPKKPWREYLPSLPTMPSFSRFLTRSKSSAVNSKTRNYNCRCTRKNTPLANNLEAKLLAEAETENAKAAQLEAEAAQLEAEAAALAKAPVAAQMRKGNTFPQGKPLSGLNTILENGEENETNARSKGGKRNYTTARRNKRKRGSRRN